MVFTLCICIILQFSKCSKIPTKYLACVRLFFSKVYKTEVLLPVLQSVARRLGQGEMYEGIALETDPLVMPRGASEIEVRAKQVS